MFGIHDWPEFGKVRTVMRVEVAAIALSLVLSPLALADGKWAVDVGPGVVAFPKYPGSRALRIWPIPEAEVHYGDSLFFDTHRGLGVYFCNESDLQFGTSFWFRGGRRHDDGVTVARLEEIHAAGKAQLFATVVRGPFVLDAVLAQDLGGSKGLTLDTSAAWRFAFSERARASVGITASLASKKFMQAWFGVSAEQSSVSALPEYSSGAGLQYVGPTASLTFQLRPRWSLNTAIAYDVLLSKAADSPIVERRALPAIVAGVMYQFAP